MLFFIALLLIALPYGIKFGAVYFLKSEKNIEANIGDVSINFFTGKFGLKNVHLYGEHMGELHLGELLVDVSLQELFSKNILVESILFNDFRSNITELDKAWNIGGLLIPLTSDETPEPKKSQRDAKSFDWGYGIRSIFFSNISVELASQYTDSTFSLNKLKVNNVLSWFPENSSGLELDLNVNGKAFNISGDVMPFMDEPSFKSRVKIDNIPLKPFLKSVKELPFDETNVSLFSDFEMEVALKNEKIKLSVNGEYGLKNILLKDKIREIKLQKLAWNGKQQVVLPNQGSKNINLDGSITLEKIDITDTENNAHILQENISLTGKYEIKLDENIEMPEVVATTTLALGKLDIDSVDGNVKLASFENWNIGDIEISSINNVKVHRSELNKLVLLKVKDNKKLPAVTTLDKFIVSNIQYQPDLIEIKQIEFSHLNGDVRLNKKGAIPALDSISSKKTKNKPAAELKKAPDTKLKSEVVSEAEPEAKPLNIKVGEILLNSKSNIRFIDKSVTPIFDTKLHKLNLSVKDIDSSNPKKPTSINFGFKIDEYGQFSLKGKAFPFSKKANAKLVAKLDALELVPLSSYAGKFAGINIKRGTLGIDADINVKKNILDVKNTFYLNQLNIESDESEVKDNIFKDMPMPLDLTLDVLRDKNNLIKLDIPVKGNINNPDFRLQDVYNTAMAKAMKFAATHYLMQAVQPLGLIITAGKLAGKAMVPKFDPLVFDAGISIISETNQGHIKKLAKILQDKDKLRFTICGNATESDWKAIQALKAKSSGTKEAQKPDNDGKESKLPDLREQVLLKLANDRTKLVKKQFVELHRISPKRLFACNGKIAKDEKDEKARPVVEITL